MLMAMIAGDMNQGKLLGKITVLIVDDSPAIVESLKSILKSHEDIEVVGTADSGYDAIPKAIKLNPCLILMDDQMPDMDGVEATRLIKQQNSNTKILFMAVHPTHVEEALKAGADGFMTKDASRHELLQHIRGLGKRTESLQ